MSYMLQIEIEESPKSKEFFECLIGDCTFSGGDADFGWEFETLEEFYAANASIIEVRGEDGETNWYAACLPDDEEDDDVISYIYEDGTWLVDAGYDNPSTEEVDEIIIRKLLALAIIVSEDVLLEAIKERIDRCDGDELAHIAEIALGGECSAATDEYTFYPNENYNGGLEIEQ